MGELVRLELKQPPQRPIEQRVRLRFQGYSPITIPAAPELGMWSPGYYRTVTRELADQLLWLHRPVEGEEPDFVEVDDEDNQPSDQNTRRARLEAGAALGG